MFEKAEAHDASPSDVSDLRLSTRDGWGVGRLGGLVWAHALYRFEMLGSGCLKTLA